jgi:GTP-binding nuclear protein Ran
MEIHCGFFGDSNVGKSCFIQRLIDGNFITSHTETVNLKVNMIKIVTNKGVIKFYIYDGPIPSSVKLNGAIIMFDKTSINSFEHISNWCIHIKNTYLTIPIILCGNKADIQNQQVKSKDIIKFIHDDHKNLNLLYLDVSAKSNYNHEKPLLYLLRLLSLHNHDISLTHSIHDCSINIIE